MVDDFENNTLCNMTGPNPEPNPEDVIFGRGNHSHPGNLFFLNQVRLHRSQYQQRVKGKNRNAIIAALAERIFSQMANRRFLRLEEGAWLEVTKERALDKIKAALREPESKKIKKTPKKIKMTNQASFSFNTVRSFENDYLNEASTHGMVAISSVPAGFYKVTLTRVDCASDANFVLAAPSKVITHDACHAGLNHLPLVQVPAELKIHDCTQAPSSPNQVSVGTGDVDESLELSDYLVPEDPSAIMPDDVHAHANRVLNDLSEESMEPSVDEIVAVCDFFADDDFPPYFGLDEEHMIYNENVYHI
jgi:hypothetical protein